MIEALRVIRLLHQVFVAFCGTLLVVAITSPPNAAVVTAIAELDTLRGIPWSYFEDYAVEGFEKYSQNAQIRELRSRINMFYRESGIDRPTGETQDTLKIPDFYLQPLKQLNERASVAEVREYIQNQTHTYGWIPQLDAIIPDSGSIPPEAAGQKLSLSIFRQKGNGKSFGSALIPKDGGDPMPVEVEVHRNAPYVDADGKKKSRDFVDMRFHDVPMRRFDVTCAAPSEWLESKYPMIGASLLRHNGDPESSFDYYFPDALPACSTPSVWLDIEKDTVDHAKLRLQAKLGAAKAHVVLLGMDFEDSLGYLAGPLLLSLFALFLAMHLHEVAYRDWPYEFNAKEAQWNWFCLSDSIQTQVGTFLTLLLLPCLSIGLFLERMPAAGVMKGSAIALLIPILFSLFWCYGCVARIKTRMHHVLTKSS